MYNTELSITSLFSVRGKIALVTGGATGIGKMIASGLVSNGAKVYIASRKEKALQEAAEELSTHGPGTCEYIVADLGTKAGCDKLCSTIKSKEDKLHILVNNCAFSWGAPLDQFPEKDGWDRVLALNVKGAFYMTVGLKDLLSKDATALDPGRVINISSVGSISPRADGTIVAPEGSGIWSYSASKAGLNHLTTSMAVTLGPQHITVNAILPGHFASKMNRWMYANVGEEKMVSQQPSGRLGETRDMAGLALFLCSAAGSYITGNHIVSDGGGFIAGTGYSRL